MSTRVRSFAKINLGLAVGPVRPDGFHGLVTCYQTIALHDFVTVTARAAQKTKITLETDHPGVPCTAAGDCERNTAFQMVHRALAAANRTAEVHIALEKRLPVQGGLGAGSGNGAAALLGLERELGFALPGPERLCLAAGVGSDVPLFLVGGAVLGLGRGEQVFPLPDGAALPLVVAVPEVGVSTAQAFRDLDAQMHAQMNSQMNSQMMPETAAGKSTPARPGLTSSTPDDRLKQLSQVLASVWSHTGQERVATGITSAPPASTEDLRADLAENPLLALVHAGVKNDFESVAFQQHPSLREIKQSLVEDSGDGLQNAVYAALSGSGSALFGIYRTPEAAIVAQHRVQSRGVRAFLTETLPRSAYWQRMFA